MRNYYLVAGFSSQDIVKFVLKVNNFENLQKKINKIVESSIITNRENSKYNVKLFLHEGNLESGCWNTGGFIHTEEIALDNRKNERIYKQSFKISMLATKNNKNLPPIITYKEISPGKYKKNEIFDPLAEALLFFNDIEDFSNTKPQIHKYKVKFELISFGENL